MFEPDPSHEVVSDDLLRAAARLGSSSLHESAGRIGALPSRILPIDPTLKVCGRALPVRCPSGDNLWLHNAIYKAKPQDVMIVDTGGGQFGYWGEVMAVAAQVRQIAGLVITGGVRDRLQMAELRFPVFSGQACIRGTGKDPRLAGSIGDPLVIGTVVVKQGDLVLGDADGVVVIPSEVAEASVVAAIEREREEERIFARLRAGESTIGIYGLPALEGYR